MKAASTWVLVSSTLRFNARHFLDTTSTTAIAHHPGRPEKCVKSYADLGAMPMLVVLVLVSAGFRV